MTTSVTGFLRSDASARSATSSTESCSWKHRRTLPGRSCTSTAARSPVTDPVPAAGLGGQARIRQENPEPRQQRSLGSERGLATPSPDGKGEIPLGPSLKIMPVDSYSMLGRSCEPAYQVDLLSAGAARRRHALAGGWSATGGHDVNCSVTWPGS